MYCSKCGQKKESYDSRCANCDSIKDSRKSNSKKDFKIILVILLLIGAIAGGIFANKYFLNSDKKLNIQVENISVNDYPRITVKIKKTGEKSSFSSNNINLYEVDKLVRDYTVTEVSDGWELKYTSDESRKEEVNKNIIIENKYDNTDFIQMDYVKPKQESVEINVSQIDSNNFPEINVYFTAKDEVGNNIKDFKVENINLFTKDESGKKIKNEIKNLSFIDNKEPVSINMVIDTSDSMSSQIDDCKKIAIDFINTIDSNIGDKIEIIEFNDDVKINNYFTSNKESLINSINGLRVDGQTALFDSLMMALNETNTQAGVKCVIAFTDGNDNKSINTPTDVIDLSRKLSIPIYIIGLGNNLDSSTLNNIANNTMGEYINISDIEELNSIYNRILKNTKEQYLITYNSPNNDEDLLETDITISVNSYKYSGNKYYQYEIKPKEYRLDVEKYEKLKEDIEKEAEEKLGKIEGAYSLAFKDISKGDMISINSEKTVAASTVKIFIMIEAYDRIKSGKLNENEIITLQDSMKVGGSGILSAEESGKKISIKELINLMMVKSDNTAANILIDKLGIDNINNRIKALGCINTELNRKMMDQAAIDNGIQNYTSVDDLALVLTKLYNGQCVDKEYDSMMLDIMKNNETKSKIPNELPSNVEVANKSGEFTGVENDAGIVFTDKGAYVLCITTTDGNSGEQVDAISTISKYVYDKYMESK